MARGNFNFGSYYLRIQDSEKLKIEFVAIPRIYGRPEAVSGTRTSPPRIPLLL